MRATVRAGVRVAAAQGAARQRGPGRGVAHLVALQLARGDGDGDRHAAGGDRDASEATLYLRGFLPDAGYADWVVAHRRLATQARTRGVWRTHPDGCAWGFRWNAAETVSPFAPPPSASDDPRASRFSLLSLPLATAANIAARLLVKGPAGRFSLRSLRGLAGPAGIAALLLQEALLRGGLAVAAYRRALRGARGADADALADALSHLRARYPRLRVVAHSLGARLLLEALRRTPDRPDSVHLLGPALAQAEFADVFAHLTVPAARPRAFLYWSPEDVILGTVYTAVHGTLPLGAVGLDTPVPGLSSVQIPAGYGPLVHFHYKHAFDAIAVPDLPA